MIDLTGLSKYAKTEKNLYFCRTCGPIVLNQLSDYNLVSRRVYANIFGGGCDIYDNFHIGYDRDPIKVDNCLFICLIDENMIYKAFQTCNITRRRIVKILKNYLTTL